MAVTVEEAKREGYCKTCAEFPCEPVAKAGVKLPDGSSRVTEWSCPRCKREDIAKVASHAADRELYMWGDCVVEVEPGTVLPPLKGIIRISADGSVPIVPSALNTNNN